MRKVHLEKEMNMSRAVSNLMHCMRGAIFMWCASCALAGEPLEREVLTQNVRPASGGWFQSQGNFGNINFDVSDSGVVAGNWSTSSNGVAVSYSFQGQIRYPSYAETDVTGITAIAESPIAEVATASGCLTCAYIPATFRVIGAIRIEFTSTRTARFVHNGTTTIPLVAWMQGLPLMSERDYDGEWLAIFRKDSSNPAQHLEAVVTARLQAFEAPDTFRVNPVSADRSGLFDFGAGDRHYIFRCMRPSQTCAMINDHILELTPPCLFCFAGPRDFFALFLKDNDAGQFVPLADDLVIHNDGRYWKAYGDRDRILIRYEGNPATSFPDATAYALEIIMSRLPTGLFRTATSETSP